MSIEAWPSVPVIAGRFGTLLFAPMLIIVSDDRCVNRQTYQRPYHPSEGWPFSPHIGYYAQCFAAVLCYITSLPPLSAVRKALLLITVG